MTQKFFDNFHLSIRADDVEVAPVQKTDATVYATHTLKKIKPAFNVYEKMLHLVGGPWAWDRRPKYLDRRSLKARLADAETRLYVMNVNQKPVGYCLVTAAPPEVLARFNPERVVEIENFGFFLNETGKGYGHYFLPLILNDLFNTYEVVYLASRSTNHKRVIPFYEKVGFQVFKIETLPEDVLPTEKIAQSKSLSS